MTRQAVGGASHQRGDCSEPGGEGAEVWGVEEDPKGVPGSQGRMGGVLRLRGGTQGGVEAIKGHCMVVSPLWPCLSLLASYLFQKAFPMSAASSTSRQRCLLLAFSVMLSQTSFMSI